MDGIVHRDPKSDGKDHGCGGPQFDPRKSHDARHNNKGQDAGQHRQRGQSYRFEQHRHGGKNHDEGQHEAVGHAAHQVVIGAQCQQGGSRERDGMSRRQIFPRPRAHGRLDFFSPHRGNVRDPRRYSSGREVGAGKCCHEAGIGQTDELPDLLGGGRDRPGPITYGRIGHFDVVFQRCSDGHIGQPIDKRLQGSHAAQIFRQEYAIHFRRAVNQLEGQDANHILLHKSIIEVHLVAGSQVVQNAGIGPDAGHPE